MRILLLEDEPEMASALKAALARRQVIVDHVSTLADAEAAAELWPYDVVVLDRRLPDGEGLTLIPKLRTLGVEAPILMLTALGAINDRVIGLDAGADDYLSKPFAVEELMARLRALARRPVTLKSEQAKVGRLTYDFRHREAAVDDKPLDLLRRERLAL
jgi:DNA-binding response OmpR family regulator